MELIRKYFPNLSDEQLQRFERLQELYTFWNAQINVISRKDIEQIYLRHVLHSLAIAKFVQFLPGSKILDVGTGGGFPGIPLAIFFPQSEFLLVDSIGKKIKVVNAVADSLGLTNCTGLQSRAETIKGPFDFVVSRAVTALPVFVNWVKAAISSNPKHAIANGILYLKGGDLNDELKIPFPATVTEISDFFGEEFFETKKIVHIQFGKTLYKIGS